MFHKICMFAHSLWEKELLQDFVRVTQCSLRLCFQHIDSKYTADNMHNGDKNKENDGLGHNKHSMKMQHCK